MDPRRALLDLCLSVEPLLRDRTAVQRRARAVWRRALAVLAPERAREAPTTDGPPDAEALVRLYYELGGDHEALIAAVSRLRFIDHEAPS